MILKFDLDGNLEDWVLRTADRVKGANYRKIIEKELKDLGQPEIDEVVDGFYKILEILEKDTKSKNKDRQTIPPDKVWLTDKEAAERLGISLATFYRRVKEKGIKKYRAGGNVRYKGGDVDTIFNMSLASVNDAYCINSTMCIDRKRRETLPFRSGSVYKITNENKIWVYLYNQKWSREIKMGRKQFRKNFRVEGELEYDAKKYGLI